MVNSVTLPLCIFIHGLVGDKDWGVRGLLNGEEGISQYDWIYYVLMCTTLVLSHRAVYYYIVWSMCDVTLCI